MSNEMNEAKRTAACVSDYLGTVATDEAENSVSVFDEWKKSGECHCKGKCTCGKRGPMGHFTKIEPIAEKVEGASDKVLKGLLDKAKKAGDKAKEDAYAHLLADSNDAKIAFVQYDAKKTEDLKDLLNSYKSNVASSDEWVAWAKKNGKPDNMTQGDFDAFTVRQKDYGEQMQKHVDAIKRVLKMRGEKGYAQDEGEFKEDDHPRGKGGKFVSKGFGDKFGVGDSVVASMGPRIGQVGKVTKVVKDSAIAEATYVVDFGDGKGIPYNEGALKTKVQSIKDEKAKFSLEFNDGTKVTFLAADENAAKLIAGGVAKRLGREVKEVKMVEKPKITEDAHNLILGMETKDACKFISETMSANVKGATRAETYLYDGGFNIEMDFPKMFGGDTLAKRDEIKAALGKIFPAALLKMNTRFGDNPFHTYQYSDSTRMSVKVPSYNSAKNDKEVAEKSVKFYEHECETFDKANAEGKYVKTNGEFQETVVSNTAFKNETARLWQERETYRVKGNLVSQKIRLISSTEFFGAVSECYKGGDAAEKAVKAWNENHNVKAFNSVRGEVALDEAEQENDEVAAFDEMEFDLHATFDEENGEITIPMTVAAFDAWDEQKHPRNHGKFAKKGEGVVSEGKKKIAENAMFEFSTQLYAKDTKVGQVANALGIKGGEDLWELKSMMNGCRKELKEKEKSSYPNFTSRDMTLIVRDNLKKIMDKFGKKDEIKAGAVSGSKKKFDELGKDGKQSAINLLANALENNDYGFGSGNLKLTPTGSGYSVKYTEQGKTAYGEGVDELVMDSLTAVLKKRGLDVSFMKHSIDGAIGTFKIESVDSSRNAFK